MGEPGYVVRGKGDEHSLNSASHGAGRIMSRTAAFKSISEERSKDYLAERGITLTSAAPWTRPPWRTRRSRPSSACRAI
jgi:tRNA-splicing ligase RtcB (3'-phosphate/5'-hydroxy nucleic acid ligase)